MVGCAQGIYRWLSILYTHVLYAWLLVWPKDLCFDHGFASIVPVTSISDPRNIITAGLCVMQPARLGAHVTSDGRYIGACCAAVALVRARAGVLLWALGAALAGERHAARRDAPLVIGLPPAAFAPAANVFVFVGTELAERLLYVPTCARSHGQCGPAHRVLCRIGLTVLVAYPCVGIEDALVAVARVGCTLFRAPPAPAAPVARAAGKQVPAGRGPPASGAALPPGVPARDVVAPGSAVSARSSRAQALQVAWVVVLVVACVAGSVRTVWRAADWRDEVCDGASTLWLCVPHEVSSIALWRSRRCTNQALRCALGASRR